ncbi:hypothetical protein EYS14_24815 [Alteromonadaceae bacterium M269]|nr:hypothetical protein EYS14_24815 [Alteromonadaceae bacterium M269]
MKYFILLATLSLVTYIGFQLYEPKEKTEIELNDIEQTKSSSQDEDLGSFEFPSQDELIFTDSTGEISQEYCLSLVDGFQFSSTQREEKYREIKELMNNELNRGSPIISLDYSAILSNMGLAKARDLRREKNGREVKYNSTKVDVVSRRLNLEVNEYISTHSFEETLEFISDNSIDTQSYYRGEQGLSTLMDIINNQYEIDDLERIERQIDIGIEPTEFDLVSATRQSMALPILKALYSAATVNVDSIYNRGFRYESLASIALQSGNFENLQFWLELGSPLNVDPLLQDSTSILLKNRYKYTAPEIDEIASVIIREPILKSSYTALEEQLSFTGESLSDVKILKNIEEYLTLSERTLSEDLARQIFHIVIEGIFSFSEDTNAKCFNAVGRYLTPFVMQGGSNNTLLITTVEDTDYTQRIDEAKGLFSVPNEVERYLGSDDSLDGKLAIEQYRLELALESAENIRRSLENDPKYIEAKQSISDVIRLARQGRWEEALSLLKSLNLDSSDIYGSLIFIALTVEEKPFERIRDLIKLGGELPPSFMLVLIQYDNVDLAKRLLPLGLDITTPVPPNNNLLKDVVSTGSPEMLNFLLSNGAKVDQFELGLDALDIALRSFDHSDNRSERLVGSLLGAGKLIEASHLSIVSGFKSTRPELYDHISLLFPELI